MNIQDAPKAKYMVYNHDTYEPYAIFFAQKESAEAYFKAATGMGEGVYLAEILDQK